MPKYSLFWVAMFLFSNSSVAQIKLDFPVEEFQQRRQKAMEVLPDGLIIFQAKTEPKSYEEFAYLQEPNFYYFTGLGSVMSTILVMDGMQKKSYLFAPADLDTRSYYKPLALIEISRETEEELLIDKVVDWNEFTAFIDRRLRAIPSLKIYTTMSYGPEKGPEGLKRIEDTWLHALKTRWPDVIIEEATAATSLRLIKSPLEIEALRTVGKQTADAFMAGLKQVKPGMTVRELQGIFVKECTSRGSNGFYFWPFIGSGEYSVYQSLRPSFLDYTLLNHTMVSGELLRIDIGCDYNHYKGDFGRTVPVTGRYDPGQREVYNLLVTAHLAGLHKIKDGLPFREIENAFDNVISKHQGKMNTDLGRKAVELLLEGKALKRLIIHDQGLGGYEGPSDSCKTGMVIMWEPLFAVEGQGFYLEDMVLVTSDGYEILTSGVPHTAEDIEELMK